MFELKERIAIDYPSEAFDEFECILTWELATIIAESNSWKTTFALDMIERNAKKWVKWYYINLEFPIETMWQSRWLWFHWKTKRDLSVESTLTDTDKQDMKNYIEDKLNKFKYYNSPNWISLQKLEQVIEIWAIELYKLFVVDTFSRIHWNLEKDARNNQNKCMEELQELAQRLNVAIVMLHHTNRSWTWEGSQKIMDLSNVFIVITKMDDGDEEYRNYKLMKDKYVVNKEVDVYYYWGKYVKDWLWATWGLGNTNKPF
jgi:hypothetical protein